MKNRNIYLYIAGACFFAMCGSLWNEFVASDKSDLNPVSHLNLVLRASDGAERSERNPANSLSSVTSHLSTSRLSEGRPKLASGLPSDSDVCGEQPRIINSQFSILNYQHCD